MHNECLHNECLHDECLHDECLHDECLHSECLHNECLHNEKCSGIWSACRSQSTARLGDIKGVVVVKNY